jgi:hypothetical protein
MGESGALVHRGEGMATGVAGLRCDLAVLCLDARHL